MERPPVLTNLLLLYLLLFVLFLLGSTVVLYPFENVARIMSFLAVALGGGVVGVVILAVIQVKLLTKESVWLQPASERFGTILANGVVFAWLCGIGVLIFVLLKARGSMETVVGAIFVVLAGGLIGRYLQTSWWSKSWLGYGVGFTIALVLMLTSIVVISMVKS